MRIEDQKNLYNEIGDNMEKKMLIKKKDKNIFERLMNFVKKIFSKKQEANLISKETFQMDSSFIKKIEEERNILNMQIRFEKGEIKEEDLTELEKEKLLNLYNQQIRDLKQDIENSKRVLNSYKEQIIVIRSKLNNKKQDGL